MSNLSNDADWKKLYTLVDDLSKRQDCEPFRDPVPWKALGLTDYPILIKHPMDLGTVKKKIQKKEYTSFLQCGEDIKLIWNNCMTYNADGSDFYKLAQSLYKRWDTTYMKFLNDIGAKDAQQMDITTVSSDNNHPSSMVSVGSLPPGTGGIAMTQPPQHTMDRKVTLQEKRNLAKSFYQLTKEDLGKVLIEIEKRNPAAIKRNASEDELDLIMDAIDVPTMTYLTNMVNGMKSNPTGKKKPPPGSKTSGSSNGGGGSKKAKVTNSEQQPKVASS